MTIKQLILPMAAIVISLAACAQPHQDNTPAAKTEQTKDTKTIHLTKDEFRTKVFDYETSNDWKYAGDKPAIVDFYADWCGPCKTIAPMLDELADEYAGQIYIYKVNIDEQPELASAFGIRSIPTLLFISMEGQPQMSLGAMPKASIKEAIDKVLLGKE